MKCDFCLFMKEKAVRGSYKITKRMQFKKKIFLRIADRSFLSLDL